MDETIVDKLTRQLSPRRLAHSRGVSETAVSLARRYGGDAVKARLAGLLHDCARELPSIILLQRADAFGIVVNDVEKHEPALLHAPVGAHIARLEYGVADPEICQAIAAHTTGGPGLSLLAEIIYLADCIEPGRCFAGVDKIRALAEVNLPDALLAAYDQILQHLLARGGLIHPATMAGRNALLLRQR